MIQLRCRMCGRGFDRYPSDVKNHRNVYCSSECRWAHHQALHEQQVDSVTQPPDHRLLLLRDGVYTQIDTEDFGTLSAYKWRITSSGYAWVTGIDRRLVGTRYLHRAIMERTLRRTLKRGELVDHIDGNPLNNRRSNLRLATHQQNTWNARGKRRKWSKYKGVSFSLDRQKWSASITIDNRSHMIGRFNDESEAALSYDAAAIQVYGDFARPNLIR